MIMHKIIILLIIFNNIYNVYSISDNSNSNKEEKRTFQFQLPKDRAEAERKWSCSACRVVSVELAINAREKRPEQWEMDDVERVEDVCNTNIQAYGLDLPQSGDDEVRYETYDHFSKSTTLPLYRDAQSEALLASICWNFINEYVLDEDELRVSSLNDLINHAKTYNDYCVNQKKLCGLLAKEEL